MRSFSNGNGLIGYGFRSFHEHARITFFFVHSMHDASRVRTRLFLVLSIIAETCNAACVSRSNTSHARKRSASIADLTKN